ncbi:MAG: AraC family transcriptional regulator [Candidatus Eremiobacteraeota bacterium]|nr:AraC family transcriptional regulator [Candidatus Eremiobacteraeota bacterium]
MLTDVASDPVARAMWHIEVELFGDLSLENVAEAAGVSRFYLSRAFGSATGRSVMRYVRGRRLSEAARALSAGAPDILELALNSGYGSHEAFTRAFSDQFGITPQAFRTTGRLETLSLVEPIRRDPIVALTTQTPRITAGEPLLLAGMADRFDFETVQRIPLLWQRFGPHIGSVPGQIGYTTYGVMDDGDDDGFDYAAAVEVESVDRLPPELKSIRIQAQTYAVFTHAGHISNLRTTMNVLWSGWLPASKLTMVRAPYFERYDERFDPQSGNGEIEIWIPILR